MVKIVLAAFALGVAVMVLLYPVGCSDNDDGDERTYCSTAGGLERTSKGEAAGQELGGQMAATSIASGVAVMLLVPLIGLGIRKTMRRDEDEESVDD